MKKIIAFCLLLFNYSVHAQTEARAIVDSLIKSLPAVQNDTAKVRLYNKICYEFSFIDVGESMKYAREGLMHAQKMKWPKGIAVFNGNIGMAFSNEGQYDSATHYYGIALKTYLQNGDKFNAANTYNNIGTAAQNIRADYSTAAQFYFKALHLSEELNDSTQLPLNLSNIARIYSLQKNYTKAREFASRALLIREKNGSPDAIAQSLEDIGKIHYHSGDQQEAETCFRKALSIYEQSGNLAGLATAWASLSLVYENDFRKMIEARIKSKKLWDEVNPVHPEAITNTGNLGVAYLDLVRYDSNHSVLYGDVIPNNKKLLLQKAELYLKSAIDLSEQTGDMDNKSFFTGALAELQELTGDYRNAFYNYKLFNEIQDSIYSQENKNRIAEAESQREIEKKNSEIQINRLAISNQLKTMCGLAAGIALLGIIGALLYKQNRTRRRTNETLLQLNKELEEANQLKAKFFGIISHDLRAPLVRLINFLHLRKEDPEMLTAGQVTEHERKISQSVEALLANMENILLWSKSQMDQLRPSLTKISGHHLFDYIRQQFNGTEGIRFHFEGDQQIQILSDENCLRTIMYNLTGNATQALTGREHAQITWSISLHRNQPTLTITDNGPGLSSEVFQNDKLRAASSNSVRSGLGLSIVKDMAKAIDCTITVLPTEKGTSILLEFPAPY